MHYKQSSRNLFWSVRLVHLDRSLQLLTDLQFSNRLNYFFLNEYNVISNQELINIIGLLRQVFFEIFNLISNNERQKLLFGSHVSMTLQYFSWLLVWPQPRSKSARRWDMLFCWLVPDKSMIYNSDSTFTVQTSQQRLI